MYTSACVPANSHTRGLAQCHVECLDSILSPQKPRGKDTVRGQRNWAVHWHLSLLYKLWVRSCFVAACMYKILLWSCPFWKTLQVIKRVVRTWPLWIYSGNFFPKVVAKWRCWYMFPLPWREMFHHFILSQELINISFLSSLIIGAQWHEFFMASAHY